MRESGVACQGGTNVWSFTSKFRIEKIIHRTYGNGIFLVIGTVDARQLSVKVKKTGNFSLNGFVVLVLIFDARHWWSLGNKNVGTHVELHTLIQSINQSKDHIHQRTFVSPNNSFSPNNSVFPNNSFFPYESVCLNKFVSPN